MSNFLRVANSALTTRLPDCWGHRGASAAFPENTLASFEAAIRDGSEGIESDVHLSLDNIIVMFHDPSLNRTTNMTGLIREHNFYGPDGLENARTKKEPQQPLCTFPQTVELLMKEENRHVVFNIDVKVVNDPERLFPLMHQAIMSYNNWQTELAPRLVLGLWHPKFIEPAKKYLSYCRRSHIGASPYIARTYFWDSCDAFSMAFGSLATWEGDRFRRECKAAGKKIMVWTINDTREMMEAVRWGADVIITDVPRRLLDLRVSIEQDYKKVDTESGRWFLWRPFYWLPVQMMFWQLGKNLLVRYGGPLETIKIPATASVSA